MKNLKQLNVSILFSALLALLFSISAYIINVVFKTEIFGYFLIFFAALILTFIFITYYFKSYIESRLKPIFKVIRETAIDGSKKGKKRGNQFNLLSDVNAEVSEWAENKQEEIKQLKALERYRKDFVGNVSHELKTPIFNIQGYILTLIEGGIEDERINMLYLSRTVKSIDRMISIVEDLESINKLESGELRLEKEVFDIVRLIEEVFEIELLMAKERNITLAFSTKITKPIHVLADKKRIFEVMSNLVINGIKYSKKGGYVKVGFFNFDDHILIEIKDNGIGIDAENLPRIFERFFRVDKHRSREQGGTGLGLSIVKHIIEAHEQTINVKSQVDVGTTFNLTLEKA